jgi:hypothetical protein
LHLKICYLGYFRKAKALEAAEKFEELKEPLRRALELDPDSADMRNMLKKYGGKVSNTLETASNSQKSSPIPTSNADSGALISEDVLNFSQSIVEETRKQLDELKSQMDKEKVFCSHAFLLPSDPDIAQPVISIAKAFESPETNMACADYLRYT